MIAPPVVVLAAAPQSKASVFGRMAAEGQGKAVSLWHSPSVVAVPGLPDPQLQDQNLSGPGLDRLDAVVLDRKEKGTALAAKAVDAQGRRQCLTGTESLLGIYFLHGVYVRTLCDGKTTASPRSKVWVRSLRPLRQHTVGREKKAAQSAAAKR